MSFAKQVVSQPIIEKSEFKMSPPKQITLSKKKKLAIKNHIAQRTYPELRLLADKIFEKSPVASVCITSEFAARQIVKMSVRAAANGVIEDVSEQEQNEVQMRIASYLKINQIRHSCVFCNNCELRFDAYASRYLYKDAEITFCFNCAKYVEATARRYYRQNQYIPLFFLDYVFHAENEEKEVIRRSYPVLNFYHSRTNKVLTSVDPSPSPGSIIQVETQVGLGVGMTIHYPTDQGVTKRVVSLANLFAHNPDLYKTITEAENLFKPNGAYKLSYKELVSEMPEMREMIEEAYRVSQTADKMSYKY